MNKVSILGIRGIPAGHGGFETFAEYLALYLVEHGWDVTVYCQKEGVPRVEERSWSGIKLVDIYVRGNGALSTFVFDWKCVLHAARVGGLMLTLGYNTAIFSLWLRVRGIKNIMNMDGIEWHRQKWSWPMKCWFYVNEKLGSWVADHLVADHPEIKTHLTRNVGADKITMIPYGAPDIDSSPTSLIDEYKLQPKQYGVVIARPEPENSILEIVTAFSSRPRNQKLVVLGNYDKTLAYHRDVLNAASDEVIFLGAIYDFQIVGALRFHAAFYVHGHQVGGTNPSLVESMGAGNAIIAHNNKFNRWVAGSQQLYFSNADECELIFNDLAQNETRLLAAANASRQRFHDTFTWESVLQQYEKLMERFQ